MLLPAAIQALRQKRPIFHSEADFQFALAWELQTLCPDAVIRLERPFPGNLRCRIDILLQHNGAWYPIELKYLKKRLRVEVSGEQYSLAGGAHDLDMHDCIKDICRLEALAEQERSVRAGYALWLTNDAAYWRGDYNASYYKAFHAPHSAVLSGTLAYTRPASCTLKGYNEPLALRGNHTIAWQDYRRCAMNYKGTVTLETERLLLRRFAPDDAEAMYYNWGSDAQVARFKGWEPHQSIKEAKKDMIGMSEYDERTYRWAIVLRNLTQPVESASAMQQDCAAKI